jgi:hypothetical protein
MIEMRSSIAFDFQSTISNQQSTLYVSLRAAAPASYRR